MEYSVVCPSFNAHASHIVIELFTFDILLGSLYSMVVRVQCIDILFLSFFFFFFLFFFLPPYQVLFKIALFTITLRFPLSVHT